MSINSMIEKTFVALGKPTTNYGTDFHYDAICTNITSRFDKTFLTTWRLYRFDNVTSSFNHEKHIRD